MICFSLLFICLAPLSDGCPNDIALTCKLQCPDDNYVLDTNGCPTCACGADAEKPTVSCPLRKCQTDCGDGGYKLDSNGCRTCQCLSKPTVECSRVMCRMFCQYGFKRDENGCEYCACNESPQECPKMKCLKTCKNGYRKDYSGMNQ